MSTPGKITNRVSPARLAIKAGDPVIVHRDDGTKLNTTCTAAPWQMCGTWVCMVDGIRGAYALCRVQPAKAGAA